jgi:hypothetical protein
MPKMPHFALQKAVYQILNTDSALLTLIQGVYDEVPQNSAFPYVVFGRFETTDWSTKTSTGSQCVMNLHVYSDVGKTQILAILDRIYEILQQGNLNVEGHHLVAMRFEYHDAERQIESRIFQGIIRFRAYLELIPA